MMSIPPFIPFTIAGGLIVSCVVCADEVSLGVRGKVTGTIESVSADQNISLRSSLSTEPLQLRGDELESIVFEKSNTPPAHTNNILFLKNGDVLPINVEQLDEKTLSFDSPWSGKKSVGRGAIDSLHFGTMENMVIYQGPNQNEWQIGKAWKFDKGLVSQAWGSVHRDFEELPERYILQFTVEWTGNAGMKCLFASTTADGGGLTDCYFLQFNSGGLELKRQSTGAKKYTSLASFNDFTPDILEDSKMAVELRVDRGNRLLQLAVNGKQLRNNIIDPAETGPMPSGHLISFVCTSGSEDRHTITDIRLSNWGSASAEARMEKRTDTKRDVLFDIESNRSSGTLRSIKAGEDLQVLFENPHDPSPKPLPGSKVAVIYFAGEKAKKLSQPYQLKLQGSGTLHVDSFSLADGVLRASHPELGELEIAASLISEITRIP